MHSNIARFSRLTACVLLFVSALMSTLAVAAEPVSKSRFGGVAIDGHDTVAYQQLQRDPQEAAVEGTKRYSVEYKGAERLMLMPRGRVCQNDR